jgi:hypothetical protein
MRRGRNSFRLEKNGQARQYAVVSRRTGIPVFPPIETLPHRVLQTSRFARADDVLMYVDCFPPRGRSNGFPVFLLPDFLG